MTITVEINDEVVSIEEGANIGDLLKKTNTSLLKGAVVGIVKTGEEQKRQTTEYSLKTNRGDFKIEVDSKKPGLASTWISNFAGMQLHAHWATSDAVAFGPISTGIKPAREVYEYQRYDVIFGTGGYDAKNTYILFSKDRHTATHGAPADGGVFARVISGKNIISKLEQGDAITQIEPVIRWETLTDKITTTDLNTPLENGMKIFTHFSVSLNKDAPYGAEHFLGLVRRGFFEISDISSSYIANDGLKGEECPFELLDSRSEGAVAVRTRGVGTGRVFISKEDRTSSVAHSVVGNVAKGMELVKLAGIEDKLEVRTSPGRVMFLGLNLREAKANAQEKELDLEIDGAQDEEAIIVEQQPETTMEILENKKVSVLCIPPELLLHIKFYYDSAPKTIEFFKHSLRLKQRPVGPLPIYFTYENTTIFKTLKRAEAYKEIMPENTPSEIVLKGEVGVTNQASKQYGLIGVKNVDDDRYGPTGEKFHSTNIIGKLVDAEKLDSVKQGDIVYVIEVS